MRNADRRRGTILIIAMVVLFALAALVLTLGRTARTDALTAANAKAAAEADATERGAEQYALATLANNADTLNNLTDDDFANVPVGRGLFWITRPTYNDTTISQYGLLDESTKLNLNKATVDQLAQLPGMTDDLASDIIAWRGDGSAGSSGGSGLDSGQIKSAPFETVDEMMLLTNMTHDLLYGVKASTDAPNVNDDWYQQHGLTDFFTVWSTPSATAADGTTARANLADPDPTARDAVEQVLQGQLGRGIPRGFTTGDIFQLAQVMDLSSDDFAKIEDYLTYFTPGTTPGGLVNVNTAPREVLIALNIAESDVDALIAARPNAIANTSNSMAWVNDTLQANAAGLGKYITGRGSQYSADIVAASGNGRAFRHVKIVIDTSTSPAKIVYRRDITDRGWPLDQSILNNLRSGQGGSSQTVAAGGLAQ